MPSTLSLPGFFVLSKAPPNFAILQDNASKFCLNILYLFSLYIESEVKNDVPVRDVVRF